MDMARSMWRAALGKGATWLGVCATPEALELRRAVRLPKTSSTLVRDVVREESTTYTIAVGGTLM
jgi:hypothetical protein